MKKVLFSFSVLGLVILTSCEKIKNVAFPSFETSMGKVELEVPVVTNTTSEMGLAATSIGFNLDSVIKKYTDNEFSLSNAGSIKVKTITIDVLNEDEDNKLSNFESVKLFISSGSKPTPIEIAAASVNESAVAPLVINGNDTELKEYLSSSNVTYSLAGKARKATTKPLQLSVKVALDVN